MLNGIKIKSMIKEFHKYGSEFNNESAEIIIPDILDLIKPKSVLDLGCGIGNWLSVFMKHKVEKLIGIDGLHAKSQFILDSKYFIDTDFELNDNLKELFHGKVDLAISLEVAEHLTEKTGKKIVDFLCAKSDVIIFSAAVPNQTGENHINEQHPSYWQELFEEKGFVFYDIFRQKYWNNPQVKWWYKQNMFLVAKKGVLDSHTFPTFQGDLRIHPEMLDMHLHEFEEFKRQSKRGIKQKIKKIFK